MCFSFRTLAAVCSVAVSLNTGCTANGDIVSSGSAASSPLFDIGEDASAEPLMVPEVPSPECFEVTDSTEHTITFADDSIGVRGSGVSVEENTAVITAGGAYRISGDSSDARIIVQSRERVSLLLDGLSLRSDSGALIENVGEGGLVISLAENSRNELTGGGAAGIYSSSDITINGSGELRIDTTGKNAVKSDGAVRLCGGDVFMASDGDGIVSGSCVLAAAGNTSINSGGDGIKVTYTGSGDAGYVSITDGTLDITSATDGIQAENAVFVSGGRIALRCGGGNSAVMFRDFGGRYLSVVHGGYSAGGNKGFDFSELASGDGSKVSSKKGIRSGGFVMISGGEAEISSADDSIYAKNGILLDGGKLTLSTGDDGLYSDNGVVISNGELEVNESYNSIEGMMVEIRGGDVKLNSRRSGIAAAGGTQLASSAATDLTGRYVSISGGNVSIDSGGSGIDSGGAVNVGGGMLTVFSGDDDLFGSVDHRDYFALSGGAFAAFGSDGATKAPSVLSRPCISVLADIAEGSVVEIIDSAGKQIFRAVVPHHTSTLIFSSDDIIADTEYSVYADSVLKKTIVAAEGICGDGPSGRVTGIFDNIGGNTANKNEDIA